MPKAKFITSVINHNIRVLLGLDCAEYVVMDVLHELYCDQPITLNVRLANRLGYSKEEAQDIINDLCEKQMLYVTSDFITHYIISEKWLSQFNVDTDFGEFWKIFREHGNRVASKKNYSIVRKSVDRETLHEAAANYVGWADENITEDIYRLKTQSWLDPGKKRWMDKVAPVKSESENLKAPHHFV